MDTFNLPSRDIILVLGGGGGFIFCVWQLVIKQLSSTRTALAADDKSGAMLDRMERQNKEQEERFSRQMMEADQRFDAQEVRYTAMISRYEEREARATERAVKAERELQESRNAVAELTRTVEALRYEISQLKTTVERYAQQQNLA